MSLFLKISKSESKLELRLISNLDENAIFGNDMDFSNLKELEFDFSKVNFINSAGIKLWVNFMDTVGDKNDLKVLFKNCRQIIVNQINLIEGFLPANANVESVLVPVYCNKCEGEFEAHLEVEKIVDFNLDILDRTDTSLCNNHPKCIRHLEVDVDKEHFLKFTKTKNV